MKTLPDRTRFSFSITRALLAGLAGGITEILWVMAWSAATPLQAATVAHEITLTVFPGVAETVMATEVGLLIHLAISLALGLVFTRIIGNNFLQRYEIRGVFAGSVAVLALIWAINFLVILPILNPVFITLMPLGVTFVSKLLFGLAMGSVLLTTPHRYAVTNRIPVAG